MCFTSYLAMSPRMVSWSSLLWASDGEVLRSQGHDSPYSGLDKHEDLFFFFFMARHRPYSRGVFRSSKEFNCTARPKKIKPRRGQFCFMPRKKRFDALRPNPAHISISQEKQTYSRPIRRSLQRSA